MAKEVTILQTTPRRSYQSDRALEQTAEGIAEAPVQRQSSIEMEHYPLRWSIRYELKTFM